MSNKKQNKGIPIRALHARGPIVGHVREGVAHFKKSECLYKPEMGFALDLYALRSLDNGGIEQIRIELNSVGYWATLGDFAGPDSLALDYGHGRQRFYPLRLFTSEAQANTLFISPLGADAVVSS